jgi:hypothetical protein
MRFEQTIKNRTHTYRSETRTTGLIVIPIPDNDTCAWQQLMHSTSSKRFVAGGRKLMFQ